MAEPAKFDMARRIAAALCYIGLAHLDRADDPAVRPQRSGDESSPGRGKGRIFRVFELLERLEAGGADGPARVVQGVRVAAAPAGPGGRHLGLPRSRTASKPGLKILRDDGPRRVRRARRLERDRDPGAFGEVRFVDAETGELRDVDVTPRLAAAYGEAWEAHAEELEHFCGRYDIGYVRADAERPFEEIILKAFRQGRFLA